MDMLPSDTTVPSSPRPADNAIFSDEPTCASSPPSSPPGFPWELQQTVNASKPLSRPKFDAFSVLGKRKALKSISDNARPAKKPATTPSKAKCLTQMQISLGQEVQKKCKACGMEYVASSEEDRKLHLQYHKQNTEGYDVGKDFVKQAREGTDFEGIRAGDSICAVDCWDKLARKKRAQAALNIVQRELGAVPISEDQLWDAKERRALRDGEPRYRAYLYVRATKCVGFLLTEKISEAQKVVEPAGAVQKAAKVVQPGMTAIEALKARKQAEKEALAQAASQPIQLSKSMYTATLGVSRIWTSPNHRHQNIAMSLLNTALRTGNKAGGTGEMVRKDAVAFSQPTEAGAELARRWFRKAYGWGVYVD